ncbi:MAG: hypothetical protein DMF30_09070 [Verrucomicrobia bacterium]|nr:MAG: hypothetical protein DMF30_09070 [Verrucomicrobiota bacterium]
MALFRNFLRDGLPLVCAATLILASQPTEGQVPSGQTQDRAQLLGGQANPTVPNVTPSGENQGYAVASPNEKDIGEQQILKRMEEYRPFTVSVYSPFFWTSNVALVSSGEEDDFVVAPGVTLLYQPRITKTFYGEIGVVQQFFLYDRFSELNFSSFDAIAGVVYYLPQFHNLSLRARYDYNRLTDIDHFDEFFVNHSIILNADLPFRIGRAQQVFAGVALNLSFYANPDPPRRNDYSFYVGYDVALSHSFSIDAAARVAVRDYYAGDRTDVSEILSLSANYRIRDWLTLSALSSFAWNQSNHSVFDYSVANIGGGVALTLKF